MPCNRVRGRREADGGETRGGDWGKSVAGGWKGEEVLRVGGCGKMRSYEAE